MHEGKVAAHGAYVEIKQEDVSLGMGLEERREGFAVDDQDVAVGEGDSVAGAALLVDGAEQTEGIAGALDAMGELAAVEGGEAVLDDAAGDQKDVARHVVDVVDNLTAAVSTATDRASDNIELGGAEVREEGQAPSV